MNQHCSFTPTLGFQHCCAERLSSFQRQARSERFLRRQERDTPLSLFPTAVTLQSTMSTSETSDSSHSGGQVLVNADALSTLLTEVRLLKERLDAPLSGSPLNGLVPTAIPPPFTAPTGFDAPSACIPSAFLPPVSPPTFSGDSIACNPKEFLQKAYTILRSRNMPEYVFIKHWLPVMLSGPALDWFLEQHAFSSWAEFESAFLSALQFNGTDDFLLEQIYSVQHLRHQTVTEYIDKMQCLMRRLATPLSAREQVRLVYRNLRPSIRVHLATKVYAIVREIATDAFRVELAFPRPSNTDPPQAPASSHTRSSNSNQKRRPFVCFHCHEVGHYQNHCPQRVRQATHCSTCNAYGHGASNCPQSVRRPASGNGPRGVDPSATSRVR